jgi:hypothetical protein
MEALNRKENPCPTVLFTKAKKYRNEENFERIKKNPN